MEDWSKSRIRMVALDLDGTTFTDDKRITERTQRAILDCVEAGIWVLPCTGRPRSGLPEAFLRIPGIRYAVTSNGAVIWDLEQEERMYESCLTREEVLRILELFAGEECTLDLYLDGQVYTSEASFSHVDERVPDPFIRDYVKKTRIVVPDLACYYLNGGYHAEKVNMSFASEEKKQEAVSRLGRELAFTELTSGVAAGLELNHRGTDKGEALLQFGRRLGLHRGEILACGDSSNDATMLKKVGLGLAMRNAFPAAKEAADAVLPWSNNEDGVARVLEELCASGTFLSGMERTT